MMRRALAFTISMAWHAATVLALQPGQNEFVPVTELPASDQLPAAPLLITAYAVVWLLLMTYLWSIWRRLDRVEREVASLVRRGAEPHRQG